MSDSFVSTNIAVSDREAGSKLLRFLERRLPQTGQAELHKWIRTGQVRVNQKRAKPFLVLCAGDSVRVPPFALGRMAVTPSEDLQQQRFLPDEMLTSFPLPVVAQVEDGFLIDKPQGLPVQGGTGVSRSVTGILREYSAGAPFIPRPVHRLDRHTSGLLLIGTTQAGIVRYTRMFASPGKLHKEYLAVASGLWPFSGTCLLCDTLQKQAGDAGEKTVCLHPGTSMPFAQDAGCGKDRSAVLRRALSACEGNAACLARMSREYRRNPALPVAEASLIHVVLLTGKTHQIRVQLAARGCPIVGDGRYGGPRHSAMLLHAYALDLPGQGRFSVPPPWDSRLEVDELPLPVVM